MTNNTTPPSLPDYLAAVVAYLAQEAPTTKAEAKKQAKGMSLVMGELIEWAEELREVFDEAASAIEQVAEADADDRESEYGAAVEYADSALMVLERAGWTRPEA